MTSNDRGLVHGGPVPVQSCSCEEAARWAAHTYEFNGVRAVVEPLERPPLASAANCRGQAVILEEFGRVECVFDMTTDFSGVLKQLDTFSRAGWAVWAVVPLGRLGEAHQAFASSAEFVQGWWRRDLDFAFTRPEVP